MQSQDSIMLDRNLLSQLLLQQEPNKYNMTAAQAQQQPLPLNTYSTSARLPLNIIQQDNRSNRERFVVFLQILLRRLEASRAYQLKQKAKLLVVQCTRNSRMGNRIPLVASLEVHLRQLVGEFHWRHAIRATHRYFRQKEQQKFLLQFKTTQVVGL